MSEIKKNIETCRGEDVLAEVSRMSAETRAMAVGSAVAPKTKFIEL